RGEHEPDGYTEPVRHDSEAEVEGAGIEESSNGVNESVSEGDGAEASERYDVDAGEDESDQPEAGHKSSKRDYSKAYGIAESKRQELKLQLQQQEYQNQMLQQQLQMMMQQNQRKPDAAPQQVVSAPDPNEDPLGYQSYQLDHLNRTVTAQQKYLEQQAKAYQEQQAIASLDNAYKASAAEFMQQTPDFPEAYRFLEQSRIKEYMELGYSPAEASELLRQDERALAAKSFKERVNPAARIYAAAKVRGFNMQTESKLEKVSQGMQKGKSLPRVGGKNIEKEYDIAHINEMSEVEFDKFFNQMRSEAKKNGDYRKDFY
ncbi:MAG: hypothetical protein V4440_13725, partial [Pseudomonadota bacterium]